jgi:7-cyano-7-deazaguanine synthase
MTMSKALVVLSGGQDSTTCLYWALENFDEVHAITFDYGQRHVREIEAARKIAEMAGVASHEVLELAAFEWIPADTSGPGRGIPKRHDSKILKGTSPLVSGNTLEQYANYNVLPGGLEKTFVPMRNQMFLTIAANRAYVLGITDLVTGVCEEDYGGYPDCRQTFIDSLQEAMNLGTFTGEDGALGPLKIHTPLMRLTKKATVELALELGGCYGALAYSHTSYDGAYPPTGKDHATLLRAKGFAEAGIPDPLVLRAWKAGLMELPEDPSYNDSLVSTYLSEAALD